MSHIRVFFGNYSSHKTQEDCVCCDNKALMPTGSSSGIFKDASRGSSEAAEEQNTDLFKCSSSGFMASHVVTHRSYLLFTKQNLTWEESVSRLPFEC